MFPEEFSIISVLIFTVPFIFTVLIVWIKSIEKRKHNQLQADLFTKALEKGQAVPKDLFAKSDKEDSPLRTGIILVLVGIGISFMLWVLIDVPEDRRVAIVGILPFFMGVAFLIIHLIEKKKKDRHNAQ